MLKKLIQTARTIRRGADANLSQLPAQGRAEHGDVFLKKAVIVRVSEGLANQMICYKAARMVSAWNDASLILDASAYGSIDGNGNRNFQLHFHQIRYDMLLFSSNFIESIRSRNPVYSVRKEMLLPTDNPLGSSITKEIKNSNIVYFDFWFATYLRWEADRFAEKSGVLDELALDYESCFGDQDYGCMRAIDANEEAVALHVRRGDYATHDGGLLLPADYYNRSIRDIENRVPSPSFFVFSDDIRWCRENLAARSPIQFVDWNDDRQGYKDLFLASRCRHFILSNESTFSHQIVQLAKPNPNRIVITSSIKDVVKTSSAPLEKQNILCDS